MGMVVSALLAIAKIGIGVSAGSVAVTSDGFESAGDILASALVFIGMTMAARPADDEHPYGHGRIEILTGLLLGFLLFAGGIVISVRGWVGAASATVPPAAYAVWPLCVSIGVKAWLMRLKRKHAKRLDSSLLRADAINDGMDIISGLVALTGLLLSVIFPETFLRADHYGACAVGLLVIYTAIRISREAAFYLMDTMPADSAIAEIRRVARSVTDVRGVEKCFARRTGFKYHVDLHLEVDPEITVRASHDIAQRVRERVCQTLPWVADVLVHVEPSP